MKHGLMLSAAATMLLGACRTPPTTRTDDAPALRAITTTHSHEGDRAAVAAPQSAQDDWGPQRGQWELTLGGTGNNDKHFDAGGFDASASVGYYLTRDLEISVRQLAAFADPDKQSSVFGGASRVAIDYHLPLGRFRPFVGGNFGWVYGDLVDDSLTTGPEGGVKFDLKRDAFLFGMLEYQIFFEDTDDIDSAWNRGQCVYTLGIGLRF